MPFPKIQHCKNTSCTNIFAPNPIKKYCKICAVAYREGYKKGYTKGIYKK